MSTVTVGSATEYVGPTGLYTNDIAEGHACSIKKVPARPSGSAWRRVLVKPRISTNKDSWAICR